MVTPANDPRVGVAIPRVGVVGVVSAPLVPLYLSRQRLVITNHSATRIFLGQGADAILNGGIPLNAGGGNLVDEPNEFGWIFTGIWYAISTAGPLNVAISES